MKLSWLIISIPVLLTLNSCHPGVGKEEGSPSAGEVILPEETGDIIISREQFESMEMVVGDPLNTMFSNAVTVNGFVEAAPSGQAKITSLVSGRVAQIHVSSGDKVRRGQTLFSLESQEIIQLQQEYGEAIQHLHLLKADFERLQELSRENVVAEKDFLKAKSEFFGVQVQVAGLKSGLEMIHIDPLAVEKGEIVPFLNVKSPISGTITRQELVLGQHVLPLETSMEVVNADKLRLKLEVFETTMEDLSAGQQVTFSTPDHPEIRFTAILSHIGKAVSSDSRTVECFATIRPEDREHFLHNMFVEATIVTCQREARALPEQSLIRETDKDFVLLLIREEGEQMIFRKMPVQTGVTRQGQTEILDKELSSVLLEGVYSLWTEE